MTSLKQNIRTVLSEVETFLVETLKAVKLNKSVAEQKERLLEKVKRILEEIPGSATSVQLNDSVNDSNGSLKISGGEGSSSGNSNSGAQIVEEEAASGYGEDITKVPASSLQNKLQSGLLDKKKKSVLKTWDSMYCVISGNIFYLYKKQTDNKQKEAFCLTGYEFQESPSLDSSRKDICFELVKAGSTTYQFRAGSRDGMIEWRDSIAKGIQFTKAEEQGETYEDVGADAEPDSASPAPPSFSTGIEFEDPDDIYEECGDDLLPPPPPIVFAPPPIVSVPPKVITEEETEPPDDIYDACTSGIGGEESSGALPPPPPPKSVSRDPSPVPALPGGPPPPRPPKSDLPALPKTPLPPPVPDRRPGNAEIPPTIDSQPPPVTGGPPPLPSRNTLAARVPHLRKPFRDREEDFENMFYGKWDCAGDSNKELSFKHGDMIHVLSKDFDTESWWVGELEGKIGLVPKEYLCPAFELVR